MRISIITVCYNSEQYIHTAIESVLSQTYPDIEYIIVDGASIDRTVEIIKRYEPQFNGRMHWISEPDEGLYDAMNKGIRMASGEIIGILNSDDFYYKIDIIDFVVKKLRKQKVDCVYGDMRYVNPPNLSKTVRYYSSKIWRPPLFRFGFMPGHPTFFTYKKFFGKYGYYKTNYKIAADFELLIRFLYTHKLSYYYLNIDILKMRMNGISTSGFNSLSTLNKEIVRACRENGIYTNVYILLLKYGYKIWEYIIPQRDNCDD
jgi:glycosyltransferase involved in cell wall biosynthesis